MKFITITLNFVGKHIQHLVITLRVQSKLKLGIKSSFILFAAEMLRIKCEDINKSMKNLLTLLFLLIVGSVAADYFIFHPGVAINKTTLNQLRASELNKLNAFRLKHRVKKLTRNTTLQTAAQNYANQLCSTLTFAHSTEAIDGQYGENLYKYADYPFIQYYNGTATQNWQDEQKDYNYTSGIRKTTSPSNAMIGHFTAQMWKKVTGVGFGFCTTIQKYVHSPTLTLDLAVLYVVANYYPTPNWLGQQTKNVFPPL